MIDSEIEMKELGKLRDKAPRNTHNKRSMIRTSHVCHRRLVGGRSQQAEEDKHKHTHTHTHTHTNAITLEPLLFIWLYQEQVPIYTQYLYAIHI